MRLVIVSVVLAVFTLPLSAAEVWQIDPVHSSASFRVSHMVVATVSGRMSGIKGIVTIDDKDITKSSVTTELNAATIWSDNKKRDDHLRNEDFLDVKKFPKIYFESTAVKKTGKGQLDVTGNLTIKGITRQIVLKVKGPTQAIKGMRANMHKGVRADVTINRQDFNVKFMKKLPTGGLIVGNDVEITLDLELLKK